MIQKPMFLRLLVFLFFAHHSGRCQPDQPGVTALALDAIQIFAVNNCTRSTTTRSTTALSTTMSPVTSTSTQLTTSLNNVSSAPTELLSSASTTFSSVSVELQKVTNKDTYPDNNTYYMQSTHNVLGVIQEAVSSCCQLTFSDILTIANFFQEFAGAEAPPNLPEGAQEEAVHTLLQITDQILYAEEAAQLKAPAANNDGYDAAATVYQALEDMYNNLPPNDVPYIFNSSFSLTHIHAVLINGSSQFEHFNLTTKLEVSGFNRETGIAVLADGRSATVASIEFNTEALQEAFEELRQIANTTPVKFSFSLSAMQAFKFARFIPTNELNERSSPIVLLASLDHRLKRKDIITIRHNVDVLFEYPSGARRQHQCIFLNYTSKYWSEDGCRMTAKHAKWNSTTVKCTCDHLTPFSLLLTLCGSLSRSFVPKDKPFTLDLAVVTTATTIVAAACCLFALLIITVRILRRSVIWDEMTFTRTGLWIALFGMYLFTIFSQLIVYAPELCGQKFCLASGILVHWFVLMSVGWTAVQTVHLIQAVLYPEHYGRKYHLPGDTYHGCKVKAGLAATLVPSVFPLLASMPHFSETLTTSLGGYGYADHEKWCWLDGDHLWIPWVTFIVPLLAAGLLNIVAVLIYIYTIRKRRKGFSLRENDKWNDADSVKHRLYGVIINTGLMGLIWLSVWLALFSCFIDQTLQYIFVLLLTVACGSQAVYIIIFQGIISGRSSKNTSSA
ncbi:adhesion G-protein coupled receptor F2-like isoform X2 [Paramacrobiotus metropolitanus]|uniref:adhesion G-protein coupled receptor F2-like isoform X2 n=1 Tax=Paramacrobiotus metropolitanus TaxID=2943436 RepID=UPI0024459C35|nr:adhesion G-protein coupled receptor F2-like isoform X2 [Paramacrobiotus metropolitanus]